MMNINKKSVKLLGYCLLAIALATAGVIGLLYSPPAPASAAGEPLTIGANVSFSGSYNLTSQKFTDTGNSSYFLDPNATDNSLVVTGNIGIGTTAPAQKLDISGNLTLSGNLIGDSTDSLRFQAGGTGTGSTGTASIYFLNSSGTTAGRLDTTGLPSNFGSGGDGAVTISTAKNINTNTIAASRSYADGIAYKIDMTQAAGNLPYTGNTAILTVDTPSGLTAGDEVLLINLRGATGDTADVGKYEFLKISTISTKTITFTTAIAKSYKGTTATNQKVVIQRIPQYTDVTLSGSGSITASAWEALTTAPTGAAGYLTGIVAFRATGTVTVASGTSITANELGYQGGAPNASMGSSYAYQGEGFAGTGTTSESSNLEGGGGGLANTNVGLRGTGAAGGGYATAGAAGGDCTANCPADTTGAPATSTYGTATLTTLFNGSGGGGNNDTQGAAVVGGKGGGIIFIGATTISNSGTISANGQVGHNYTLRMGGAGGGAGGSIFIASTNPTLGTTLVTATGGTGGTGYSDGGGTSGAGGTGGVGRIRVEYSGTLSGTTSPSASTDTTISSGAKSAVGAGYGTLYLGATNTSSSDLAEYYVAGDSTISAGDVVSISDTKILNDGGKEVVNQGVLRKADKAYDSKLIGIISTNPGVLMGSIDGENKEDKRILALSGRVPVKIAPDSPLIEIGDFLTSSATYPGMAMKATRAGSIVGKALENWTPPPAGGSGKDNILMFLNVSWYDPNDIPALIKTSEDQQSQINKLRTDNEALKQKMSGYDELKARLSEVEMMMNALSDH